MRGAVLILVLTIIGCSKSSTSNNPAQVIPVPNGDFELWAGGPGMLSNWQTNSCPPCVGAFDENIIQGDAPAYSGLIAAKFIYNFHFRPTAENKFYISAHPTDLTGFVKSSIVPLDTVSIAIKLYNGTAMVDSGQWIGTASIANYTQITIPLTQSSASADSAYIRIQGGRKGSVAATTQFWVDNFFFEKF